MDGLFDACDVTLQQVDGFVDFLHLGSEPLDEGVVERRGDFGLAERCCAISQYRVGVGANQAVVDS